MYFVDIFYIQVDKHIRKLDADLARFEADLKDKSSSNQPKSDSDSGKKGMSIIIATIFLLPKLPFDS